LISLLGGGLVAVASGLAMSRMFPKLVFEIGVSARRGERAKTWRVTVGSVLILGIVAAAMGGLIVEMILH
jgi:hypothetical protein